MATTSSITTFKQLLQRSDHCTDRDLMQLLRVSFTTLKERERDPSKLSMEQLFRLAAHLDEPLEYIVDLILAQVRGRVLEKTNPVRTTRRPLGRRSKQKGGGGAELVSTKLED